MIAEFKVPCVLLTPLTPEDLPSHVQRQFQKALKRKRDADDVYRPSDELLPLIKRRSVTCLQTKNAPQDVQMGGISPPLSPKHVRDVSPKSKNNFNDICVVMPDIMTSVKQHPELPSDILVRNEDINQSVFDFPIVPSKKHVSTTPNRVSNRSQNGIFATSSFSDLPRITSVRSLNQNFQSKVNCGLEFKQSPCWTFPGKSLCNELSIDCSAPIEVIDVDALPSPSSDGSDEIQIVLEDVSRSPGPHLKQLRRLSESNPKSLGLENTRSPQSSERVFFDSPRLTSGCTDENQNCVRAERNQNPVHSPVPPKSCELKVVLDDILSAPKPQNSSNNGLLVTQPTSKVNQVSILKSNKGRKTSQSGHSNNGTHKAVASQGLPTSNATVSTSVLPGGSIHLCNKTGQVTAQRVQPIAPNGPFRMPPNQHFAYLVPRNNIAVPGVQFAKQQQNSWVKPLRDFQTNLQYIKPHPAPANMNNMNLVLLNNVQLVPYQNSNNGSKVSGSSYSNFTLVPSMVLQSGIVNQPQVKLQQLQPNTAFIGGNATATKIAKLPPKLSKSKENKTAKKKKASGMPLSPKKTRFTTSGRKIPNYAEFNVEEGFDDVSEDDESVNSDSSTLSKSLTVQKEDSENVGTLKKTDSAKAGIAKGGKKKSKSRTSVYDDVALEDLYTIANSKTRYRVGFKKYGHIFSSALDRINRRMNNQSQFWSNLKTDSESSNKPL